MVREVAVGGGSGRQVMAPGPRSVDQLGSLAYASSLKATGREIRGAIVLECVGYACSEEGSQFAPAGVPIAVPSTGDFLAIIANTASAELAGAVERAANRHVPDLKTLSLLVPGKGERLPDTRRSDHAPFWDHGYPAIMLTDTANFRNPHYHQLTDTLATLDLTFMQRVAQAVAVANRTSVARRHVSVPWMAACGRFWPVLD